MISKTIFKGVQSKFTVAITLLATLIIPLNLTAAGNRAPFKLSEMGSVVKQITGNAKVSKTDKIVISIPEIAEVGSEVGVRVNAAGLKKVESITILAEKNTNPMLASFIISKGTDPFIKSRVKLRESTNVVALIKADGKFYKASKLVKITIGGCGGGAVK